MRTGCLEGGLPQPVDSPHWRSVRNQTFVATNRVKLQKRDIRRRARRAGVWDGLWFHRPNFQPPGGENLGRGLLQAASLASTFPTVSCEIAKPLLRIVSAILRNGAPAARISRIVVMASCSLATGTSVAFLPTPSTR